MRLGPIVGVTVIVPEINAAVGFYQHRLGLTLIDRDQIPSSRALALGVKAWADRQCANFAMGSATLQLIESPSAVANAPRGWSAIGFKASRNQSDLGEISGPGGERWQPSQASQAFSVESQIHSLTLSVENPMTAIAFYRGLGLLDCYANESIGLLQGGQLLRFSTHTGPAVLESDSDRLGIRLVSFARSDARGKRQHGSDDPTARVLAGASGEGVELI